MAKKDKNTLSSEFTDIDGGKWIQTSAEDMFSLSELNKAIESIEKEKDPNEIVLARIDFRTVNKEYHDAVIDLQTKLKKKEAALNKLIAESRVIIDRKNKKLMELIDHIKKLQFIIDYNKLDTSVIAQYAEKEYAPTTPDEVEEFTYDDVTEVLLDDNGNEISVN